MRIEALISPADQFTIKPLPYHARFVTGDQKDRLPLWVKREGYPPLPIRGAEAELLHIGVA